MALWKITLYTALFYGVITGEDVPGRMLKIDETNKVFELNGHPFRYVSGSIHYFRIHPDHWNDRLRKIRAGGMNAIEMYVEWSSHEKTPGTFNFNGINDIVKFVQLAKKNDLYVILRPGPFIDAERDKGGLPSWLNQLHPDVKLRTSDQKFLKYVDRWFQALYVKLKPLTFENGGPIIMVQVENEYGSYATQTNNVDTEYLVHLRDLIKKYLGNVFMFSTDAGSSQQAIRSSKIPEVYSTVDFGSNENYTQNFYNQRLFEPNGPMVNSEYYTGWLDFWAYPHQKRDARVITKNLDAMLKMGASVNLYMVHGGTTFGLQAGGDNVGKGIAFCPTSYDYDAPITEAGDLTQKYFDVKNVIKKYMKVPDIPVNKTTPKGGYGKVTLKPVHSLFVDQPSINGQTIKKFRFPLTFEQLGQAYGIVSYETKVKDLFKDPSNLSIEGLADRAYVFVNGLFRGILDRMSSAMSMPLSIRPNEKLQIFVENMGRIAFGPNTKEFKGITSNVTLDGLILQNWTMRCPSLDDGPKLIQRLAKVADHINKDKNAKRDLDSKLSLSSGSLSFWQGHFNGCSNNVTLDTFLSLKRWKKGVAYVNGFNIGKYWPVVGPQQTLYVPGPVLRKDCKLNTITIFEQDEPPCLRKNPGKCEIEFVKVPNIDSEVPIA